MPQDIGSAEIISEFGPGAISLRLKAEPLELAWKHCGITSDFLSTFYAARAEGLPVDASEVLHNVSYLVNEILENAVKFRSSGDIVIDSVLDGNDFRICISNTAQREDAARFQKHLEQMTGRDPSELLIEQIERNAADPESTGSGLGLLTLMGDYGAKLGWRFVEDTPKRGLVRVEAHALLPLG